MTDLYQWQCATVRVIDAILKHAGLDAVDKGDLAVMRTALDFPKLPPPPPPPPPPITNGAVPSNKQKGRR